jgi:hypothetical protein
MTKEVMRDLLLWVTVLAGPVFWLLSFEAKFSWTQWACASQTKAGLFFFALIALALTAGAGLLAWRQWKQLGNEPPSEAGSALSRSRFMALGGMAFSIGFCVVIVAQTIPDMILGVCQ